MTSGQSTTRVAAILSALVGIGLAVGCGKSTALVRLGADASSSGGSTTGNDASFAGGGAGGGVGGTGVGGATATTGSTGTGGAVIYWDGGAPGSGGTLGTGGGSATGGKSGTGGVPGTGGAIGTGGGNTCGGPWGTTCAEGMLCDVASSCGKIADVTGVCVPTNPRATCPATAKPVCGCENRTYSNDCQRQAVGMLKASDGTCPPTPTSYPTAYLAWQLAGSSSESGPAVIVDAAAGRMDIWDSTAGFSPELRPANPTTSKVLSLADTDSLWVRLSGVVGNDIPHGTPGGTGCNASLYFRNCRGCVGFTIRYSTPEQVTPELSSIWSWFDSFMDQGTTANPRTYCK